MELSFPDSSLPTDTEEITERGKYGGLFLVVPIHLDDDLSVAMSDSAYGFPRCSHIHLLVRVIVLIDQAKGWVYLHHGDARLSVRDKTGTENTSAGLDKPQVGQGSRTFDVGKDDGLPRLDDKRVFILSCTAC